MTCPTCGATAAVDARFCAACGAPLARRESNEERKLATFLFADLVGSTRLGGSQDPERTRVMLDRFYDAMAAEITRGGGTVEKFAGDAVMAVFGAPAAQEDHAERALHVALAMRRRLRELFEGQLEMRVGVNSGEVVVGRAREGSSFVTGDAVNVSARLEQSAAPGEIVVGERTASLVRGAFEFDEPVRIEAKGKDEGVVCRRLVRALTLMRPRGGAGLGHAFVGRDAELGILEATYRRTVDLREPHLVTIMGEAGVGKTRLVRELWERLGAQSEEPTRRTGRCLPYGHAITYWPLGEILREHLGILETDAPEAVRARLGSREILGLALGLDVGGDLHPLAARDRLHEAWVEFFETLAAERPSVVLVEDLHWAEEPLLDLLERAVRDVRGPLLVLVTARPELLDMRPAWGGGRRNATLLSLEPLNAADAARMIDPRLAAALPDELRARVVERAEGNPFFVEELVGSLIDRGIVERVGDDWRPVEVPAAFEIPDSVQAVLAARIDLLPAAEKAALQAAAVIGRVFWPGAVRALTDGIDASFDLLEERDFARRRGGSSIPGEREYAIKHALTREVAYGTLPKAKRARLHASFGEWLEAQPNPREFAPLLAHHYAEAVRPEDADLVWAGEERELERLTPKAREWLMRAGRLAIGRYELEDGIELLERAIELGPPPETEAELWRDIGRAHALRFDGEAFWTAMQRSLVVCSSRAVCGDTYSLLAFHTSVRSGMWRSRPEIEKVNDWIARALDLAEPGSAARARALIASAFWTGTGAGSLDEAARIAEELGDAELRSSAFDARAQASFHAGRVGDAHALQQRRFDIEHLISDPDQRADLRESAIPMCFVLGRFREARRLAAEHEQISATMSAHHRLHSVALRAEVEEVAGAWEDVRRLRRVIEEAVAANEATPCVRNARSLLLAAVSEAVAGDVAAADELERRADELGMSGHGIILGAPKMRLALLRGEPERVDELVPRSGALWRRSWVAIPATIVRLDALTALRDRSRIEEEAPALALAGTILEPFALRSLGVARGDDSLILRAAEQFGSLDLRRHERETRALL